MTALLIANLVVSGLILCVVVVAGARIFVLTVRAKAQRNGRPKLDPEKVAQAAAAVSVLLKAASSAKAQRAAADPQPATAPPTKDAQV